MVLIVLNNTEKVHIDANNYSQIVAAIEEVTTLNSSDFYLIQNGAKVSPLHQNAFHKSSQIHLCLRVFGGKGGFGSMLRAIGAQIEKTTNREACRDLSGRRLRDINEEKRLKTWLEKQPERKRQSEERKKKRVEKLLSIPTHEFKDEEYEQARSKLTEKVNEAVEEGFKKVKQAKNEVVKEIQECNGSKRKAEPCSSTQSKKRKAALWIGDDISDDSDSDSDESEGFKPKACTNLKKEDQNKNQTASYPSSI